MYDFKKLFAKFKHVKIAVVGDVMLDTYWMGQVDRISPEAPVPVVAVSSKQQRMGGAANVALNIAGLGASVHLFSVTGQDDDAQELEKLCVEAGVHTTFIKETDRPTTNKIRIISRNQHMLRLDAETKNTISNQSAEALMRSLQEQFLIVAPDLLIFEDYNKGVLSPKLIGDVTELCKKHNVLIAVDPKQDNFFNYTGVDIFKPNLHEVAHSLHLNTDDISTTKLKSIHESLHSKLKHNISLVTMSEKGVYVHAAGHQSIIPTHVRNIADVSGAGDTVIAVASVVYAATKNAILMAEMANIAGGLVCEEVGTVAINADKLLEECEQLLLHSGGASAHN